MTSIGMAAAPEAADAAALRRRTMKMLDVLVAFWIFCGAIVIIEPSPYEFAFALVLPVAIVAGIGLYRSTLGLLAILVGFTPFALIACFQVTHGTLGDALVFSLVTIFLLVTSYFVANYVAEAPLRRMRIIVAAYTVAALAAALVGILAYLGLIPGADIFLLYGRARATFKDPNVYGPFLVLPAMFALQRVLLGRGWQVALAGGIYVVLFVGIFVSFSRAAWGHLALSSALVVVLVFWLEAGARDRLRILAMSAMGVVFLGIALAGLLSIPQVSALFEVRTEAQAYDSGETGRFGRLGYALDLAIANPLGLGPGQFAATRIREEPHNVYVQVLHAYGWGGGLFYYLLVVMTLWKGVQGLSRPSPYRLLMIPVMGTYVMLVGESLIIDTDHWRHYFLLAGLVWGISAAIGNDARRSAPRDEMLV